MTIGERMMKLITEYQESVSSREDWPQFGNHPGGRDPATIAAEYETAVLELVANQNSN